MIERCARHAMRLRYETDGQGHVVGRCPACLGERQSRFPSMAIVAPAWQPRQRTSRRPKPVLLPRACEVCQKPFVPRHGNQRLCGSDCQHVQEIMRYRRRMQG